MIERVIRASVENRVLVLFGALLLAIAGIVAVLKTPVDALPDLSDVQVIIKTDYSGQAPEIVENEVTYPISTTMLSVPGASTVRGFSLFGTSFVYVLFEDGTDLYWARSRVLESLNSAAGKLPSGVTPELGPDATGVGWIYQYALVDKSGKNDLESLRALQDWFLKYELKTIPGVAEVASVGGAVKEYQIIPDPVKLEQYGVTVGDIKTALSASNQEAGGGSIEMGESEFMVRAQGYLKTLDDFRSIVLKTNASGTPTVLGDVAQVRLGPEMRRGIAELDGEGEVAGGIILLRTGGNAREVIAAVKTRLEELKSALPEGVEIVPVYDRSSLIDRAIQNLTHKLIEEFIVVALVCAIFLWHVRSALVAVITLPLGLALAFIAMHFQGLNANIMSLGGIAIAVGAMVDAAIVMIENAHKHIEAWEEAHPGADLAGAERWQVITEAAVEVGPALLVLIGGLYPVEKLGGEFLPQIAEGDILYMPSTLPGVSSSEAAAMLQKTDKLIRTVPEVATVFGKAGRADTATDSAPLEMIETTIQLKPESEWRPGMTMEKIIDELDKTVRLPGLANLWVMPIRNRIDMLSTGVKSPIGIKVSGQSLADIDGAAEQIEEAAKTVPGVVSAIAERLTGGRYVEVSVDRLKAARWGLTVAGVQSYVKSAVGGEMAGDVVDGIARYPITIRFPQSWRDSPEALRNLPIISGSGQSLTLGDVAEIRTSLGPSMLRTENARPAAWVFVDARDRDMASVVGDLREAIAKSVSLKPGVSVAFSGQYELMERAKDRLTLMVPMTILIIFVLLYLAFRRFAESLLILGSLPFALTGGIWLLYLLGDRLSVAVGTGFIALAGLAAEFGVVMIVYLRHAVQNDKSLADPKTFTVEALDRAIEHGAALRVRPKTMTVAVVLAGLIPILVGTGAGSEVMSRIAAPMVGGMVTAPLLSLFVIPAAWKLIMLRRRKL